MAHAPVGGCPLVGPQSVAFQVQLLLVIVIKQRVACRSFQAPDDFILSVETGTPAVGSARIVAGAELALHAKVPFLRQFFLCSQFVPRAKVVALGFSHRGEGEKAAKDANQFSHCLAVL